MLRLVGTLVFVLPVALAAVSQSIPKEFLSTPARLELSNPTMEVKVGSTVTYTVTLKNVRDEAVAASANLQLEVETPSGQKTVVLPAGQSSATFTWQAANAGAVHMTVRSGKLHPASGLVLVTPSPTARLMLSPVIEQVHPVMAGRPPVAMPPRGIGARIGAIATQRAENRAGAQPAPQSAPPPPASAPAAAAAPARKIQLYIEPLPVVGNAVDHVWKAKISVAALGDQDALVPVASDVPIHFNASSGSLAASDITLPVGKFSNFDNPVVLTADHSGKSTVNAISSLGPAGPIDVEFIQPSPMQLRLSLGTPVLAGTGSSTAMVQACLLDEAGAITSSGQDVQVTLTAPGQLASSMLTIHHDASCSDLIGWTSDAGAASIQAEAEGLKSDSKNITFPSFPWYFVWLAAAGGLVGALITSSQRRSTAGWWSHTWRSLLLGVVLGVFFYLFARFGAIVLPQGYLIDINKIPAASGVGALVLGFLGGLYGRKLWKVDK